MRQQAEGVERAEEGGSGFSMAGSPHFCFWQPGRRQGRVLGVWWETAGASAKCLHCFRVVFTGQLWLNARCPGRTGPGVRWKSFG